MSIGADTYAQLSKDCYNDHKLKDSVTLDGVMYRVIGTVNHSQSGFEATAYQSAGTGEVVIAYRGTETNKIDFQLEPVKDLGTDRKMVQHQTNAQLSDATAFTDGIMQDVLSNAEKYHQPAPQITVTGHSLGGTLAEIEAARLRLGGTAFNAYGAADLGYGVPEGQPRDAPAFTGYARATDVVSSASRHYGSMHIYANQEDITSLHAGHYLDAPSAVRVPNPLLAASLSAHFITNFAPDAGKGESIMTAANEARYRQHQSAVDHYRNDVMVDRIGIHTLLDKNKADGIGRVKQEMNRTAAHLQISGQAIELGTTLASRGIHATGDVVQANAESFSLQAHVAGQTAQRTSEKVARAAHVIDPINPLGALGIDLGVRATGFVARHAAEEISVQAHAAGQAVHRATGAIAHQTQAAGEAAHVLTEAASQRVRQAEQATERVVDGVNRQTSQAYEATRQAISQGAHSAAHTASEAYESLTHPGSWFEHKPAGHGAPSPQYPVQPAPTHGQPTVAQPAPVRPVSFQEADHPQHALYARLKEVLPPHTSEARLAQATAACLTNNIEADNLGHVHLNEKTMTLYLAASWPPGRLAEVDLMQPPPTPAHSVQQVQVFDQQVQQPARQAQLNAQAAAQQSGPVMG